MSNQKLGVAIFAGLLIVTGIASSGRFFDANVLLDRFMDRSSSDEQMAALPEGVELAPEGGEAASAVEPEEADATTEVEKPAEMPKVETAAEEQPAEQTSAAEPEQVADEPVAPEAEKPMETIAESNETAPAGDEAAAVETTAESNETAPSGDPAVETTENATQTEPMTAAAPPPAPPIFDLLRVEPNGDMVVAGVSSPGADMELVAGTKTLTKTTANANGEFVAILDEALNPGDYEIVLRSTDKDGVVMTSAETAIVSIPEAGSDEVIALVEAPGAPSRLITVPEVETAAAPAVSSEAENENTELASTETESTPPTDTTEETAVETASVEPTSEPAAETTAPVASAEKRIRIEAVEIDGPTVFVAGAAEPGTKLRIYANEILLGDTQASAQGRFLIEVNKDLPVGDYIVRADALSSNGAEVVMRAAVPFTRSAGEKLAAIAVPATTTLPNEPPKIAQETSNTQVTENGEGSTTADTASTASSDVEPQPAQEDTLVASAPAAEQNTPQAITSATLEQPLRQVENSVVIRRGDTLWHISKRVYGQGIKYTTIYKANDEQIRDPDMIWPGQVFALPEEEATSNN